MVRKEISISLDEELLNELDSYIGEELTDRNVIVEHFLNKALGYKKLNKALILCGGKGTRLRPLTYEIPKPLLPVKGKPILEHQIILLKKFGVENIILSIGYLGDQIKNYFGDGSKWGVKINYVTEEVPLGTGGGIKNAKLLLSESFIVFNGDNLIDLNVENFFNFHKRNKGMATIVLKNVEDVKGFGVVNLNGSNVTSFIEKPISSVSNLINAGVYLMEPEALDELPEGISSIEKDLFEKICSKNVLNGFVFEGKWFPTDTPERYETAILNW